MEEKKDASPEVVQSPPATAATQTHAHFQNPDGSFNKELIHADFMASDFVEWTPYAASRKFTHRLRNDLPVAHWVSEKRRAFTVRANEEIADLFLRKAQSWQKDVIQSLERYPRTVDAVMHLVELDIQARYEEIKKHPVVASGRKGKAQKQSLKELDGLATILAKLVTTKYKALLLSDTSVKIQDIVKSTQDANQRAIEQEATDENKEWTVEIMGAEKIPARQLTGWIAEFYDKAQRPGDALLDPNLDPEAPAPTPEVQEPSDAQA